MHYGTVVSAAGHKKVFHNGMGSIPDRDSPYTILQDCVHGQITKCAFP